MGIELDAPTVRAGEVLRGRLTDDDNRPASRQVDLARVEKGAGRRNHRAGSTTVTLQSDEVTGEFSLTVPASTEPTVRGRRVSVNWVLRSSRGLIASPDEASVTVLAASDVGASSLHYAAGEKPPILKTLRSEHFLSMFVGLGLASVFGAFAIAINVLESEAPASATLGFTIGAVFLALILLVVVFLAARTIWPSAVSGFQPTITPGTAEPGGVVSISSTDPWPDDLRFLCVETYDRVYAQQPVHRHRYAQFDTYEHSERPLVSSTGEMSFQIPKDAAPSVDGERVQIRWVVRRGGSKIGRWGPIRLSEWAVIVR